MEENKQRIFDKNKYSEKPLRVYGILSRYFVDIFYNELYDQAIRLHRKNEKVAIVDNYKHALDAFLHAINNANSKLYKDLMSGIHQTFEHYEDPNISYQECVDNVAKEFIPSDYWNILSYQDKGKVVGIVIANSTKAMIHNIAVDHIDDVINIREGSDMTDEWQNEYVDILISEREKLYQQIINAQTGSGENQSLVETMRREIRSLYAEKKKLREQVIDLKKKNIDLGKVICKLHKSFKKLESDHKAVCTAYKSLKELTDGRSKSDNAGDTDSAIDIPDADDTGDFEYFDGENNDDDTEKIFNQEELCLLQELE